MALTPTQEAQVLALIAQEAALLSLASAESSIISNLGATDVSLSDLTAATGLSGTDLLLVRQGTTDKSATASQVAGLATAPDASTTVKGIVELATNTETQTGTDTVRAVTPAGLASVTSLISTAKIQSISASVASNALTISASALDLDFRSTTLGSGTVTNIKGTPSNLVISSGSTLGTFSGQQSDIAVLAINNAGTIELAVANLSGGVNLDESGLISTTAEGGAGAADSAAVIYSTTARTNVAYRVIGVIRSTQTTAGTWATAPSLVQGAGGNAMTALQSFGYGQSLQDLTASRAFGTTYYNTTGRVIGVYVSTASTGALNSSLSVSINGGASIVFARRNDGGSSTFANAEGWFFVAPGQSYNVTGSSSPTLSIWNEFK